MGLPKETRQTVFEEKVYQCYLCHRGPEKFRQDLSIHHIDGDRSNNAIENLLPVCQSCHVSIHRSPTGDYAEWHEKLPEESRFTSEDIQDLYEEREAIRKTDSDIVVAGTSFRSRRVLPLDLERDANLEFPSEKSLEQALAVWNDGLNGTLYYRTAHPGNRRPEVTHKISYRS